MNSGFKKSGKNTAIAPDGTTVELLFSGGILYRDQYGEIRIDAEWRLDPPGIAVRTSSYSRRGLGAADKRRTLHRIVSALECMGHRVELL